MFNRITEMKRAGLLIFALAVAFSLSGCGSSTGSDGSGPDSLLDQSAPTEQESLSSEDEGIEFTAELSYANYNYIDTGNESEDKLIREVELNLTAEEKTDKSKAEAVLKALKKVPSYLENAETFVSDHIAVNYVKVEEKKMIVDLSSDGLDSLSMYDEEFFVFQVTDSLLNTFPEIDSVEFTVDGAEKDGLNYMDISESFTRASVSEFLGEETESSAEKKENETASENTSQKASEDDEDDEDDEEKKKDDGSSDSKKNDSSSSGSSSSTSGTEAGSSSGSSSAGSSSSSGSKKNSGSSSSSGNSSSGSSSSGSSSSGSSSSGNSSSGGSSSGSSSSGSSSSGNSSSGNSSGSSSGSSGSSSGVSSDSAGNSSSSGSGSGIVDD